MKAKAYLNGEELGEITNVTFSVPDRLLDGSGCFLPECGGIILADTEDWSMPVCNAHFEWLGAPEHEPDWSTLFPGVVLHPPAPRCG